MVPQANSHYQRVQPSYEELFQLRQWFAEYYVGKQDFQRNIDDISRQFHEMIQQESMNSRAPIIEQVFAKASTAIGQRFDALQHSLDGNMKQHYNQIEL